VHGRSFRRICTSAAASSAPADIASAQSAADAGAHTLQLYNTMARARQPFEPRSGNAVSMYVCGVTVYDLSHIGHARVYVAFDVLFRLLTHLGYEVDYVRNFTDIDDKIIKRAAERDEDPLALSARFIDEFHRDMAALGCLPPTCEPKATDHVGDMVDTIERIIANGHAYVAENDVFFDVKSLEGYGRLSRHQLDSSVEGVHD
jgi:cysteinyl-tRNA synthetase